MKFIEPFATEVQQQSDLGTIQGILSDVVRAAKICYQTTKTKLTDKQFVEMLINKGHLRPLEFGTVYLTVPQSFIQEHEKSYDNGCTIHDILRGIRRSPWTKCSSYCAKSYFKFNAEETEEIYYDTIYCITTNLRVVYEVLYELELEGKNAFYLFLDSDFKLWRFLTKPTDHHYLRHTFNFICSRGCGDDFRTHVAMSSMMESTRYSNYSLSKFHNEVRYIMPDFKKQKWSDLILRCGLKVTEWCYLLLTKHGEQPQYAKNILPLSVKTQLMMCAFKDGWRNFVERRDDIAAYPECQKLAKVVRNTLFLNIE